MSRMITVAFLGVMCLGSGLHARQPRSGRAEGNRPSKARERPRGAPENRWRYQYADGRWWYLMPDDRWSYFDGARWRPFLQSGGYVRRPVDPAMLRLEYKEGVLGRHRWPRVAGQNGGSLPLSGTQGAVGGSPSGSFTDPRGVPSGMNTSTGTSTGIGGLGGGGRAVSGSPLSGGGGAVGQPWHSR